ncbi:hypothetical protein [Massilia sp. CCM 8734]|uniref:hypothetical protein n=1 Tax=Massilia sp. CCM 8734 TaxID=2609283 RepID=UPI001423C7FA|nr:hypothetical protein [Massilia sp. CCM 8734]NHZ98690.1 hypothetical protein [Massilia sp. CCM 8734]
MRGDGVDALVSAFRIFIQGNTLNTLFKRALCAAALGLLTASAHADSASAAANFFGNAEKAGIDIGDLDPAHALVTPTLVKGLYATYNASGKLMGVINEAGTLYGKAGVFSTLGPKPGSLRLMTPAEVGELRAEVMAHLAYDKLIKVTYGNGGGRKILTFSSVDCRTCFIHETELVQATSTLNTTFYIAPASLRGLENRGLALMEQVARIMCEDKPGVAWQKFWATREAPPAKPCALSAQSVHRDTEALSSIMAGVKSMIQAVPMFIAEDGSPVPKNFNLDMTPEVADTMFGAARKRVAIAPTTHWLAAAKRKS